MRLNKVEESARIDDYISVLMPLTYLQITFGSEQVINFIPKLFVCLQLRYSSFTVFCRYRFEMGYYSMCFVRIDYHSIINTQGIIYYYSNLLKWPTSPTNYKSISKLKHHRIRIDLVLLLGAGPNFSKKQLRECKKLENTANLIICIWK